MCWRFYCDLGGKKKKLKWITVLGSVLMFNTGQMLITSCSNAVKTPNHDHLCLV